MRSLIGLAAIGCTVAVVEARGPYKWSQDKEARDWHPARATPDLAFMAVLGDAPAPTAPPKLDEGKLRKRTSTDNTCAYISGENSLSLYCGTDSACVFNSVKSNIGCCPDSSTACPVWTTCYESSESDKYTTSNGFSLWCGSSAYPHCVQHIYGSGDLFTSYTLLGCGKTKTSDVVFYSATNAPTTTSRSRSTSSTSSTTDKPTVATTTVVPTPTASEASGSAAPTGAIVGGVVGGIAALGLIGLGIFFIIRRTKQSRDMHDSAAAPPPQMQSPPPAAYGVSPAGYGGPPPPQMAEQPMYQAPYTGFAHVDNRSSIAKPPYYDVSVASSPPTSPPPHSPSPMYPQYGVGTPPPQQTYAPGMGHQSGPVAELDTSRGDREVRELA